MSDNLEVKEDTYMQRLAKDEFERFEELSNMFYEMIDSLHRLGDFEFLNSVKVDGVKLTNSEKIKRYIYEPRNIMKILVSLDKINTNIEETKKSINVLLKDIDRMNVTDPEEKVKRSKEKDTKNKLLDIFVPLIMLIEEGVKKKFTDKDLNESLKELDNAVKNLEEEMDKSDELIEQEVGIDNSNSTIRTEITEPEVIVYNRDEVFRSRPRIPRNLSLEMNRSNASSYFNVQPIDRFRR